MCTKQTYGNLLRCEGIDSEDEVDAIKAQLKNESDSLKRISNKGKDLIDWADHLKDQLDMKDLNKRLHASLRKLSELGALLDLEVTTLKKSLILPTKPKCM